MTHIPHPRWLEEVLAAGEALESVGAEGPAEVV
jgi:hypothetical protein